MKYAMTFAGNTAGYRVHAVGCSQARDSHARQNINLFPQTFDSIEAARAFANADESEKAGEPTRANFKVCKCAKPG